MPFGLRNAPETFQRAVDIILSKVKWKFCLVYIDDIVIFSKSPVQQMNHINEMLGFLKEAGMTIKLNKCFFMHEEIEYFGHIVKPKALIIARKTIADVQEMDPPATKTQLRSFLGMCNVYRRFVPRFASIASPLNFVLRKEASDAFELN